MADEEQEKDEAPAKSGNMKMIIIVVVLVLLLVGGVGGGVFYFMGGTDKEESAEAGEEKEEVIPAEPPQYTSMDPKFVVSFRNQSHARFMQFSIEVMARNKDIIMVLGEHSPAVRSSLLMLFDSQTHEQISTREGKQKLLVDIITDINATLKKVTGEEELVAEFEAAYFTSFVIQ